MIHSGTSDNYRTLYVGLDQRIPLLNGSESTYINLDNAASTPPLALVQQSVNEFMLYYSSVHRGTGFKSQLSTYLYEKARQTVLDFLGANSGDFTCVFGKNTTEAINKLARRFPFDDRRDMVLTSGMEHHSNDLPWRDVAKTIHTRLTPEGRLDESDFDAQLSLSGNRIALVAITGASNVTGFINPIHRLAEKAHAVGAMIMVDAAQLAAHRQISIGSLDDPSHLDFVAISGHKMYAPYGSGALVGRRDIFQQGDPDMRGGCFCAHPYILHLLGLSKEEANAVRQRMLQKDRRDMPGMVRASFGLYNTPDEVTSFIESLVCITRRQYRGQYNQEKATGEYKPLGWNPDFNKYISM